MVFSFLKIVLPEVGNHEWRGLVCGRNLNSVTKHYEQYTATLTGKVVTADWFAHGRTFTKEVRHSVVTEDVIYMDHLRVTLQSLHQAWAEQDTHHYTTADYTMQPRSIRYSFFGF